jgi:hypothetical protein
MSEGQLIARGKVLAIRPSTFEGKTSLSVQMLKRTGKGAMEIVNIKMPEGTSPETYPEGSEIEFVVDVIAVESSAYFRFLRDLKADTRGTNRPAAAAKPVTA